MSSSLGDFIKALEASDPEWVVPVGIAEPHSWRGDYMELAFQPAPPMTIGEALAVARSAMGQTYQGYKGGDFEMNEWTPVHLSFYGSSADYFPLVAMSPRAALEAMKSDDPHAFVDAALDTEEP